MATDKWIRLVRLPGPIPRYALPDDDRPLKFSGRYSIRWPDGTINDQPVRVVEATARNRDGTEETGTYAFFEVPYNGMTVIYDLHEVELQAGQVSKRRSEPKKLAQAG